jgi:hypothetical protein
MEAWHAAFFVAYASTAMDEHSLQECRCLEDGTLAGIVAQAIHGVA